MADTEKLLKAMECSLRPCRERDDCKECKYRFLEKVDDRLPCPPDVEEDGIKYWQSCDCDGMVKDAIETIRELQELTKGLSETHTSNPMYELGYKKGATDMEKAKQIIIDKLQEQLEKARAHLDFNYKSGFEQGRKEATKWYLCSEKFPADYENVLVDYEYFRYGDYNCMFRTIGIAYYSHEYDRWHVEGGGQQIKIHAWRELPKFEENNE